jgi:Phosphatidylinositol 3- and 4-kinase
MADARLSSEENFFATVLTETGKVAPIKEGHDGARKVVFRNGLRAALKLQLFSNSHEHGIRSDTAYRREAAAYQYDRQLLGWNLVPPTTLTVYKGTPASIQAWVSGVPARELAPYLFDKNADNRKAQAALLAAKVNTDALRRLVLFDLLIGNTDRHGRNALFDTFSQRVWAIDNGRSFGRYMDGYYQVFHRLLWPRRLALTPFERSHLEDIALTDMRRALSRYLAPSDITMAFFRLKWVLSQPNLGFFVLSSGRNAMPAFSEWFLQEIREVVPSEVSRWINRAGA